MYIAETMALKFIAFCASAASKTRQLRPEWRFYMTTAAEHDHGEIPELLLIFGGGRTLPLEDCSHELR
jgi:hypothetical protein